MKNRSIEYRVGTKSMSYEFAKILEKNYSKQR